MSAEPRISPGRLGAIVTMLMLIGSHSAVTEGDLEAVLGAAGALGGSSPWRAALSMAFSAGVVSDDEGAVHLSETGEAIRRLATEGNELAARRATLRCIIRCVRQDLLCLAFMTNSAIEAFVDSDTVQCLRELGLLDQGSEGAAEWWTSLVNDARAVDREYLKRLGDMAEERSVAYEKTRLAASGYADLSDQVQWVSRIDESLGFDLLSFTGAAPDPSGRLMIEVKACGHAQGRLRFFLTRNEWETALRNPGSWVIHFWRVRDLRSGEGHSPYRVVPVSELVPSVPVDVSPAGQWTVCEIRLSE